MGLHGGQEQEVPLRELAEQDALDSELRAQLLTANLTYMYMYADELLITCTCT